MSYSRENEIQTVKDIQDGHSKKYRLLVDRYSPMIFMVVRSFAGSKEEEEELAQQIFVKAYERIHSFNAKSKFSTWLYSLALNHCRDFAKNIRRLNRSFSDMEEQDLEARMIGDETPDQQLEEREGGELLKEALRRITPEYSEAFLMKYRDGMTYQSMSERLDSSVGALKVRVYRAKKELKEFIENQS